MYRFCKVCNSIKCSKFYPVMTSLNYLFDPQSKSKKGFGSHETNKSNKFLQFVSGNYNWSYSLKIT